MHAIELLARAIPESEREPLPGPVTAGLCAVTGASGPCVERKHLLSKSFTNGDRLACPGSSLVSVAAWWALKYRPERASSWWCDGRECRRLNRAALRALVLEGSPAAPWAGYLTTSYKKHGSLRAPVNAGPHGVWLYEETLCDASRPDDVRATYARLLAAQAAGISRPLLEELDPGPAQLAKIGVATWLAFEAWARPCYRGGLYRLCVYCLPTAEERAA